MRIRPPALILISILIGLTLFRAQTLLFLPKLATFGGIAPDAWLVPWICDAAFGLLVPVVLFFVLRGRGIRTWGLLIIYNALGAFDYAIGLATQWQHPLPVEMASAQTVFIGIGLFMFFQLVALGLLWRQDVITHFSSGNRMKPSTP